ncbi:MAG: hypothetical protein U0353_22605 [Sandaracinus sp.]
MSSRPSPKKTRALGAWRVAAALALAPRLAACATPEPVVVPIEIRIGAGDPRCRPTSVRAARIGLEGDFAPGPMDTVELLTASGIRDLTELRAGLRALRVEIDGEPSYTAVGRSLLPEAQRARALAVLPALRPCALLDPDATLPEGAALVAHPDGSVWIVGGVGAERRIVRVDARTTFADVHPDALFNRREGASASVLDRDVIVAGGASGEGDTAYDSYERLGEGALPASASPGGRLSSPRRDHAALRVGGRLVLVGGRSGGADDALVGRIDVIDLEAGTASLGPALATPRLDPVLLAASDGAIVVAGGTALDGTPIDAIERIDPGLDRARSLDVTLPAPSLVVPLGLDRLLHVSRAGLVSELRVIDVRSDPPRVELLVHTSEVVSVHGLATSADRVIVAGLDRSGRLAAELWTPHLGTMVALEIEREPHAMARLVDGLSLEIDGAGASLRAVDEPGPWASLPNDRLLFPSDLGSPYVSATLPGDLDGARATRSGVRIGVPSLVFGALSVSIEGQGARTLVLRGADESLEISFDAEGNVFGPGCSLASAGGDRVIVSREGARLELVRGAERSRCGDVSAGALFAIEVELERDAELSALQVSRRAS